MAGDNLVFTDTITGTGGITPTGTVTWTVTGPNGTLVCSSTTTLSGSGSTATATCTLDDVIAGPYSASAVYSGDSNDHEHL